MRHDRVTQIVVPVVSIAVGPIMIGVITMIAVVMVVRITIVIPCLVGETGLFSRSRHRLAPLSALWAALSTAGHAFGMGIRRSFFGGFGGGFFVEESLPVGHGDLIVVGMDFVEGEEAVSVPAIVDEGRLERRLYARDLCEINIAAQKLSRRAFVVEFLDATVT